MIYTSVVSCPDPTPRHSARQKGPVNLDADLAKQFPSTNQIVARVINNIPACAAHLLHFCSQTSTSTSTTDRLIQCSTNLH